MGVGGQHHSPAGLPPGKTRCPLYRRLGTPQGRSEPVWENLASTGIRSPDRPARSEWLYRLSYRGPSSFKLSCNLLGVIPVVVVAVVLYGSFAVVMVFVALLSSLCTSAASKWPCCACCDCWKLLCLWTMFLGWSVKCNYCMYGLLLWIVCQLLWTCNSTALMVHISQQILDGHS